MRSRLRYSKRTLSSCDGLSLIELLVAVTLFVGMALAAAVATLSSMRANRVSENRVIAVELAEDSLECARYGYRVEGNITTSITTACLPAAQPGFTIGTPVENPVGLTVPVGMTGVSVTVSWTGHNSGSVTLTTLVNT